MEMRGAARRGGHLAPGGAEDPLHEFFRRRRVARVAENAAQKEAEILVKGVALLPQRTARAHEVAADFAIHEQHEGTLRLPVRVVGREVVGEKFAILEDRVDGLAEKARGAAQFPDACAVSGLVAADFDSAGDGHFCGTAVVEEFAAQVKRARKNLRAAYAPRSISARMRCFFSPYSSAWKMRISSTRRAPFSASRKRV